MKKSLRRIFMVGWTNFKRNSYLSVAATGIITLTLVLFLGLLSLRFLTNRTVIALENKIDISAYFKPETPEDQILQFKNEIAALPVVENVEYVSRDQALEQFKLRHASEQMIQDSLAQLDFNPLTASLNIKATDPTKYEQIATYVQDSKYKQSIDKISFYENKDVIERIQRLSTAMRNWGLLATAMLAIIGILVMFNTIRLTIYNQRQEIEIMRLVGASNWHIRGPFLAEGTMYGFFGAIIAIIIFYPIVYLISGKLAAFAPDVDLMAYFITNGVFIFLIAAVTGIVLGVVSSIIAMRKHLQV